MYFKIIQRIVAFFASVISLFIPEAPVDEVITELPPVNPNAIAESVTTQDIKAMSFNVKITGDGYQSNENRLPRTVKMIEKYGFNRKVDEGFAF